MNNRLQVRAKALLPIFALLMLATGIVLPAQSPGQKADATFTPLTHRDEQWYGSTFWSGPDWTRVGRDWQHPGTDTPSVRRFVCPQGGRVTVSGRVFKRHLAGDGIRALIRLNEREVWKAEIDGKDERGVEPNVTLDVKAGDSLRFIIHKRGEISCDTTHWDPLVTYADGAHFQASQSFDVKQQGAGGWHYEMLGSPRPPPPRFTPVSEELRRELQRLAPALASKTDSNLLALVLEDWWREDQLTDTSSAYQAATARHLASARRLAADLHCAPPPELQAPVTLADWRTHYLKTRLHKRAIALGNPLLNFRTLLFCKRVPPSYSHLVGQYFGWRQRPGGGLFTLENPGHSLRTRDLTGTQLPPGSFLEPRLSYDARRVAFSYVATPLQPPDSRVLPVNEQGGDEAYFHLYEINVDGTGLRQLTRGAYDDLMPCYLPDGGFAFVSTRRRSYSRCFGPNFSKRWHSYTLHRMDADGGNLGILSLNDVNEWFPAVAHSGEILFARWDYIDRDAVTHQNLWAARPDGTNPLAVWGNAAPSPHCTFQARPIPGSHKIVFIASAHHAITGGPVCVLDPSVDHNRIEAVTRLTPGPFPEAESSRIEEYYESPWPLSEQYFLVAYSRERLRFEGEHMRDPNPDNALGLYLLDAAGNRELLYRDPLISSTSPMPLRPEPVPPVLASVLPEQAPPTGEMIVTDVYQGLGQIPRGHIKELRIVQIFPKTTWLANQPLIGCAGEENARAILGTVPVESDGSAHFTVPAHKPLLLQALDADGFAFQTMRSTTYVQPGERVSCVGCHEPRRQVPSKTGQQPLAMTRAPSRIEPGELGGEPFSFVRVVQPVLDRHCVKCHGSDGAHAPDLTGTPQDGFTRAYWALCGKTDQLTGRKMTPEAAAEVLVPRFGQRNQIQETPPGGRYGALGSRLMKLLRNGHEGVRLTGSELRRLAAWIDLNAVFHGSYDPAEQARQSTGAGLPMPNIQ
ncbi:MAG: hypothetical protein WCS99_02150 [Limisphaerales bacterium]